MDGLLIVLSIIVYPGMFHKLRQFKKSLTLNYTNGEE